MTVAFLQSLGTVGGGSASSLVLTLSGVTSTAGNSLVVVAGQATSSSTPGTCVDSQSNSYTSLDFIGGRDPVLAVWLATGAASLTTSDTITVNMSSAASGIQFIVYEFSGPISSPEDATAKNSTNASSTTFDTGVGSVATGDHLLIGAVGRPSATAFTATPSNDGTWNVLAVPATAASFGRAFRVGYQVRSGGGGNLEFTGSVGATAFASNSIAVAIPTVAVVPPLFPPPPGRARFRASNW